MSASRNCKWDELIDSPCGSRNSQPITFRDLLLLAALIAVSSQKALPQSDPPQPDSNSALGALSILRRPSIKVTLSSYPQTMETPDPPQWYILAYRGSPEDGLFSIAVAKGQIVQEKPSLNLGELFKSPNPIAIERIAVDSPTAFDIAQQRAAANGRNLGTASYVLQQTGAESAPVWQIWCYDRGGRYFGYLENRRHQRRRHFRGRLAKRAVKRRQPWPNTPYVVAMPPCESMRTSL